MMNKKKKHTVDSIYEYNMDEFDTMLMLLHESTKDTKIREALIIVQEYKMNYIKTK